MVSISLISDYSFGNGKVAKITINNNHPFLWGQKRVWMGKTSIAIGYLKSIQKCYFIIQFNFA